jgi:hypothetical protein
MNEQLYYVVAYNLEGKAISFYITARSMDDAFDLAGKRKSVSFVQAVEPLREAAEYE